MFDADSSTVKPSPPPTMNEWASRQDQVTPIMPAAPADLMHRY